MSALNLLLKRTVHSDRSTIGELSVDGRIICYTLEDVEREAKIAGKTAIPKGVYDVTVTMSSRFKKLMPLIENVPGFSGVRIHSGNTAEDTEGCILVGLTKGVDFIGNSRIAFDRVFLKIHSAEKVTLTIE